MLIDLEDWIRNINETQAGVKKTIDNLTQNGYWNQFDIDFRAFSAYTIKFFNTANCDLQEAIDGIHNEIKDYHIKILLSLAKTARETHDHARKVWANIPDKKYGDPIFQKIESIYYEIRDMLGDMYDINNLAHRLTNFIGRKVNSMNTSERVTNVFNAPVTGVQQNFDESTGTQNFGFDNTTDLEELKGVILEIRELLIEVPKDNKEEIEDSINDLEEVIQSSDVKKSKLRAFGGAVTIGLKKLFTIQALENAEKISTKLPQVTENFEKVLSKIIGS